MPQAVNVKEIMEMMINKLKEDIEESAKELEALKKEIFTKGLDGKYVVQDRKLITYYERLKYSYYEACKTLDKLVVDYRDSGFLTEEEESEEKKKLDELRKFLEESLAITDEIKK
jgi:hypothetical protein